MLRPLCSSSWDIVLVSQQVGDPTPDRSAKDAIVKRQRFAMCGARGEGDHLKARGWTEGLRARPASIRADLAMGQYSYFWSPRRFLAAHSPLT